MACSASCPTPGVHETWGECVRAKGLQIANVEAHKFNQNLHAELNAYRDARYAGLQPASTQMQDVKKAWKITEATGVPYRADAS